MDFTVFYVYEILKIFKIHPNYIDFSYLSKCQNCVLLRLPYPSIEDEKKFIELSYERLLNNSKNHSISRYVKSLIYVLVSREYRSKFCYDLCSSGVITFNVHGKIYPCEALLYRDDVDIENVHKCNKKDNLICNECWAQGICSDCAANFVLGKNFYIILVYHRIVASLSTVFVY